MKKINVAFENCYGIPKLNYEFDFSEKRAFVVYAPNGAMKTSFAKTFQDIIDGNDTKDEIYPERKTLRVVTDENNDSIVAKQVFVIQPAYDLEYKSEKNVYVISE